MEENEKNNLVDWGGCTVFGESVSGTLIARCSLATGNTQDNLIIVILGEDDE